MTPFAELLLSHLQGEHGSATTSELAFDFEVFADQPDHEYAAKIPDDVPKAVREALAELVAYQRIEGDERGWRWIPEKEKPPAQRGLFE